MSDAKFNAMHTAPKDNTILRLLVDYSNDGDHALEDAEQAWTIGFNNFEDTEIDEWQLAGWSWSQDCFCEGRGQVIGWLPFQPSKDEAAYHAALRDDSAPMESNGDEMTAAESVLAYLAITVCGALDDEPMSPLRAQKIVDAKVRNADRQVEDLAMIVRKLSRFVPENVEFREKAMDYLQRNGLMGSPLR